MKTIAMLLLSLCFAVTPAQEKPKDKPKTATVESPYVKLTLKEIDGELSNIEALREQYIAALNMLEGQKQFLLRLRADSTKVVR